VQRYKKVSEGKEFYWYWRLILNYKKAPRTGAFLIEQ